MEVARSSECFQRQDLAVVPKPDATKAEEPKARWPYISKLPDGRTIIISKMNPPTERPCAAYTKTPPDDPGTFSQKSKLRVTGRPIPRPAVTGQTRCPYPDLLPKNATVSSGCDVVCTGCNRSFVCFQGAASCNQDAGRAELRLCNNCMRIGDHWTSQCPEEGRFFSLIRRKVKF